MHDCKRHGHKYFIAESALVEREATLHVVIVCTACGEDHLLSYKLTDSPAGAGIKIKEKERN